MGNNRSAQAVANATLDAGTGVLYSASLCGGSDAATAVVRTGGSGGTVLCKLGCAAGASVERTFRGGVAYTSLHVTLSGTSPQFDAEI